MRGIKLFVLLLLLGGGAYYAYSFDASEVNDSETDTKDDLSLEQVQRDSPKDSPKQNEEDTIKLNGQLYKWIGKTASTLKGEFGAPTRKDLSSYGYTWWVYTNQENQYIQFGVENDKVVTVYATGENLSAEPAQIGQGYGEVNEQFDFNEKVSLSEEFQTYEFKLTKDQLETRPLVKVKDDIFIQFYFDRFTESLSSIRVLNTSVLLLQRPYKISYRGELPEKPTNSKEEWKEIDSGMEQQVFDLTNIIRNRFDKSMLDWNDRVAEVAFGHSKDMALNNYFSHFSPDGNGLKERLKEKSIIYSAAGENIAAQYPDAPAAVEGWLNSEGHRKAMLTDDYSDLGVGVYRYYYTQNFLKKQ
ncbi:CAP domain-containing protein [Aquibacillus sp. 3ASR75-11]|uniref:CAP domain-containing protein n=1 Tax=Terrihalobacillus insolitus TaxID=2950438 RepID=A0A9X3WPG5_9BACI|nr:CAP domain-containing protein [Terrihalobacillus insolitus]MDC3412806.1 CAP domain-containing protein [Terrihalobacillus insolitus]MDC3423717.1 CAP domain-containing protein [Terrihalobacillus insolitus]